MSRWRLNWPMPGGTPEATAQLKTSPADFQVTELLETGGDIHELTPHQEFKVPGQGEHLLIYLEKTGDNTGWVAHRLGELSGCGDAGIGYCGLKDRHAITRQWFSVQRPGLEEDDEAFINTLPQQWQVLAVARRARKLRRGEHSANRFRIRLRDLTGDRPPLDARLTRLASEGCPNYFGRQRFGHDGSNLDRAIAMAARPVRRRRGRKSSGGRDGLYFSAARSWLFNEVLAERVGQGSWRDMMAGEPEEEPTGPLWGDGGTEAVDAQGVLERQVIDRSPEIRSVFSGTRMAPERRPLILMPTDLEWTHAEYDGASALELGFTLLPGQFATTLLSALVTLVEPV